MAATLALVDDTLFAVGVGDELLIGEEIVEITGGSGTVADPWTLLRGRRGTTAVPHYAGASVSTLPHTLEFTKGATTWDLTAVAQPTVIHLTISPGGEMSCDIEFFTYDPAAYLVEADSLFVMKARGRPYFSGICLRPQIIRRDDGGAHIHLQVRGYYKTLSWDVYTSTIAPVLAPPPPAGTGGVAAPGFGWWAAYTAEHTICEEAVRDLCPFISLDYSHVIHGGQSISKEYNGKGKSAQEIITAVTAQGDVGEAVDHHVWTDVDGGHKLELLRRSGAPLLKVPVSTVQDVSLAWEAEQQKTKVVLTYANGIVVQTTPGATVTRTLQVDVSNQIDDLGTATSIARQLLYHASLLQAIGDNLVLEWPKKVYDSNDMPVAHWEVRAGMAVLLCNDDLTPLLPWVADLPIGLLFVKQTECNHRTRKTSLALTEYMTYMEIATMYATNVKREAQNPASPAQQPVSGPAVAPPENMTMPGALSPSVVTPGNSGRIGYDKVADEADISGPTYAMETENDVLVPGRKADLIFPVDGQVLGFRMTARTKEEPSLTGSCSVNVGYLPKAGGFVAAGSAFTTLTIASDNEMTPVDLDPIQSAPDHVRYVEAGDHLSFVLNTVSAFKVIEILVVFRRTEGSARAAGTSAPIIQAVSATRDGNNVTTFTITSDQAAYAQIEYGLDTTYGSLSGKSEIQRDHPEILVVGLPQETIHYRAHVWDSDNHETISADQIL